MTYEPAGGYGVPVGAPPTSGAVHPVRKQDPAVPAAPQGPGVAPPFAAPPTDRNRRGLWIGLGIGGTVLLLCCVGGLFGLGVLVVGSMDQARTQATTVVTTHLEALLEDDIGTAHDQFCNRLGRSTTRDELAAQHRREPFTGYRLDEPRIGEAVEVTARLAGAGGAERSRVFRLDTGGTGLCIGDIR